MKVLCISDDWRNYSDYTEPPLPKIGEECIVIRSIYVNHLKTDFYQLEKYPQDVIYTSENFAPISDIDETQMERNYSYATYS